MHLNQTELSLRLDVLTFEYITLSIHSSDQKYINFVNSVNLLKNRFRTMSEKLIVELLLTTVKINQLYMYLLEIMKQNKRITKKQDITQNIQLS